MVEMSKEAVLESIMLRNFVSNSKDEWYFF